MWLSKQVAQSAAEEPSAAMGVVSVAGASPAVVTDGERRRMKVAAPWGYHWRPAVGQPVVVLRGEDDCILGTVQEPSAGAGEILITNGAASLLLTADGRVLINGKEVMTL